MAPPRFILASESPRRRDLLAQIGYAPDEIAPAHIDETPEARETPRALALRLARVKAETMMRDGAAVLAADTVVGVGRRVLPKAETEAEARMCWALMSGRAHRVFTAVALAHDGKIRIRLAEARVSMKRLTPVELDAYIKSGEWRGKAGGYAIQGLAGRFVIEIGGSYSAIVGLPLYETANLLQSAGITVL
ncbi:MAG: Maf family nucleotide pyrophosphatase [Caulobacterales bacterium]